MRLSAIWGVGLGLAAPCSVLAQQPIAGGTATATVATPSLGGGQVVGSVKPQPRPFAPVSPQVGNGLGQTGAITNPTLNMPGMTIDPSLVVGPLPESFVPGRPKSEWEQFLEKYGVMFGLVEVPKPPAPWTPGLSRRNRERAAERIQQWWRD
jgi:hypothetical protein